MTTPAHTTNRLTDQDRADMRLWITERRDYCETIARAINTHYVPQWAHVPQFERTAARAIGCTAVDLRDSELDEIRAMVLDVLGAVES